MPAAETIDQVIAQLDRIIAEARRESSRLGYFPALYRKVTIRVKQGIASGEFEDGPRMERLDVIFANRYIEAIDAHRGGARASASWELSFEASRSWRPLVVQHLLLGMNAHINLDLGVAAAETAPGAELPGLYDDFCKINVVLASLVDEVKAELGQVWRPLPWLDRMSGSIEDVCVNFSMTKARDAAWSFAQELADMAREEQLDAIARRDRWTAGFGRYVWRPPVGALALLLIRLGERRSVADNIQILV